MFRFRSHKINWNPIICRRYEDSPSESLKDLFFFMSENGRVVLKCFPDLRHDEQDVILDRQDDKHLDKLAKSLCLVFYALIKRLTPHDKKQAIKLIATELDIAMHTMTKAEKKV